MNDLRSSKQQLREELEAMYHRMTDPKEIELREMKEQAQARIKDKKKRYGL